MSEVRHFNPETREWQKKPGANTVEIKISEEDMKMFGPIEEGEEGKKEKEIKAGEDR